MNISFRWIGQVFWNRGKMVASTFQVNDRRELQLRFSRAIADSPDLKLRKFGIKQVEKGRIAFITIEPPGKTSFL